MIDVKTGDLILFTSGEYSGFGVDGVARALRPFTTAEVEAAIVAEDPRQARVHLHDREYHRRHTWLVAHAWVEEVTYVEHHDSDEYYDHQTRNP